MNNLFVSIIITTKNEEENIKNCLDSIMNQSYKNIEVIVVDNNSTDQTKEIVSSVIERSKAAQQSPIYCYNKGPERSAQRNFGAKRAKGEYLIFLDADMILNDHVIQDCVSQIGKKQVGGVIIPEKSFGTSFWAKCKALERSFYVGNDSIEAARFFDKIKFVSTGGYDERLTGPEDWDLSQKINAQFGLARISSYILHNEGSISLLETIKKKYYYAKRFSPYMQKKENRVYTNTQFSVAQRYWIFLSRPFLLFKNPLLGLGVLFMKTAEFGGGALGMCEGKWRAS